VHISYMCVRSYSKAGAIEQRYRYMVNSGVRGTGNVRRTITSGPRWTVRVSYLISILLFHNLVSSTGTGNTPGDFIASGSSLVLPRDAADTRGQYSTLHYTGGSAVRYAMQGQQRGAQERRREGGTRERGTGRRKPLQAAGARAIR
jgi:hypothetical protein